jgi:hypothetical protein
MSTNTRFRPDGHRDEASFVVEVGGGQVSVGVGHGSDRCIAPEQWRPTAECRNDPQTPQAAIAGFIVNRRHSTATLKYLSMTLLDMPATDQGQSS